MNQSRYYFLESLWKSLTQRIKIKNISFKNETIYGKRLQRHF